MLGRLHNNNNYVKLKNKLLILAGLMRRNSSKSFDPTKVVQNNGIGHR